MMLDEVQTGNGRTGDWFAYQGMGFVPDVVTTAKGLGNGFPIGACLARSAAADVFGPGHHGSTYGGNPFVCNMALTVIETLEKEALLSNAKRMGALIRKLVAEKTAGTDSLVEIRGKGLMLGFQLDRDCPGLVTDALHKGLLVNVTCGNTVRLLPPLVISEAEATELAEGVADLILSTCATAPQTSR